MQRRPEGRYTLRALAWTSFFAAMHFPSVGAAAVAAAALAGVADAKSPWPGSAKAQAAKLIAAMTLEEKVTLLHGTSNAAANGGYVGSTDATGSFPSMHLEDGPQGVADEVTDVTCWPSALAVAQTWDRHRLADWGRAMAEEQSGKGTTVLLGPCMNLARVPTGGRAFEASGEDPFLTSALVAAEISGIQSIPGISACAKHFILNDFEAGRTSTSSNVDLRTYWETYMRPFIASVNVGVGSFMCSYNRINNTYACENEDTLGLIHGPLGFEGWIMSDWGATHSMDPSIAAGLDQEMPASDFFGPTLIAAVKNGSIPEAAVDAMATRIATTHIALDMMRGATGNLTVNVQSKRHEALAADLATEGAVLLKNDGGLLPVAPEGLKKVVVLGDQVTVHGYGSGGVYAPYVVTPFEGVYEYLNGALPSRVSTCTTTASQSYVDAAAPCVDQPSQAACQAMCVGDYGCAAFSWVPGMQCNGWGTAGGSCYPHASADLPTQTVPGVTSGVCAPAPVAGPRDVNVTVYSGTDTATVTELAAGADLVLVNVATVASESYDRANLSLPAWQDAVVAAAAAANPATVVIARCPGACLMPWSSSVRSILYMGMSGQESGRAIARLVFGDAVPSGKLPVSFPASEDQSWITTDAQYPGVVVEPYPDWLQAYYTEGQVFGYKWFEAAGETPAFPFGHGLSYVPFSYSSLKMEGAIAAGTVGLDATPLTGNGSVAVTFTLTRADAGDNSTNPVADKPAAEVAQVYIGFPQTNPAFATPAKQLKGFEKVWFKAPGEAKTVTIPLSPAELTVYDEGAALYRVQAGTYSVYVGASATDLRLKGSFTVA